LPSTILVQKPGEQAQSAEADLGVRTFSVDSRIDSISVARPVGEAKASVGRPFDFEVDLSECGRTEETLRFRYSFSFGRLTSGQVCKIRGEAVVRFSQLNPGRGFNNLGGDLTNEIAVEIFRRNYESVYLLHGALAMEAPSPWITQDVSLSSRNEELEETSMNQ
jgi:hypothetical protein